MALAAYDTLRGLATHTLMHAISVTLHGCQAVAKRPDFQAGRCRGEVLARDDKASSVTCAQLVANNNK